MISRRELVRALGVLPFIPHLKAQPGALDVHHRLLGRTGRWVSPLGLGGQASLQWTPAGVDPPDIIVRAVELGVNYLDTANAYGPSQANYGRAFDRLHLKPQDPDYNPALRERIFLATKTGQRVGQNAVNELRQSLSVMFGDGRGAIPDGAYLDSIQLHNLTRITELDQAFAGMAERGRAMPPRPGALAALMDYRDGTNYTGLNPEGRRWIRHIGITGHLSSAVLMEAIRRDRWDAIDTLLVALNANDREYQSHQFNVVPLARARGLGIIAMKLFADGVFYGKEARFSRTPADVIETVGRPGAVDSTDLVRYAVSIPGVSVAITGIGRIDREVPEQDQLVANAVAAVWGPAGSREMRRIEGDVAAAHGTETNYFNERLPGLVQPGEVRVERENGRVAVRWTTALAGRDPIRTYAIWAGDRVVLELPYRPQLTEQPLEAWLSEEQAGGSEIKVEAVAAPA